MKKFFFILFFQPFFYLPGKTQEQSIPEQIRFISYLIDNAEYRDALSVIHNVSFSAGNIENSQSDSLNFFAGWAFYSIRDLDSSALFFNKVSPESGFYYKSKFYQAFDYFYNGYFDSAKTVFNSLSSLQDSGLIRLKNFELAGIALLQRDYQRFRDLSMGFDSGFFPIVAEQEFFFQYNNDLQAIKSKSPFWAGFLSALFPGSGKFYAGYRGQAIAAALPVVFLGAVTLESFLKIGMASPQFIIFGGMFSVFYLGNIWGSALSVKTKKYEQFFEIDQKILVDLHLPLRRVFN